MRSAYSDHSSNQLLLKQEAEIKAVQDKYADSLQIIEKQAGTEHRAAFPDGLGNPSEFGKSKSRT